ncbi:MAG TPA: site-2 protease family protein [Phycisphaerales bacterium]|nr:site-2 protease family protein [Phycisphaerales bacterium]
MNWWAADMFQQSPALFASWVFWVIFSIVMHELAHGWAALWCGDDTPRALGHMTWNPLVHMGGMSLIMFAVVGIAWGAMPVSPSNFRGRHDDAIVSGAGPAMNLVLFIVAVVLGAAWWAHGSIGTTFGDNLRMFFFVGAAVNLALMILNLLPVPPLDGSKIVATFVPAYRNLVYGERGAMFSLIAFALVFFLVSGHIFDKSISTAIFVMRGLTVIFGGTP